MEEGSSYQDSQLGFGLKPMSILTLGLKMMLAVLILVFLPRTVCRSHILRCPIGDTLPINYKYHEPGDHIIGAIASQFFLYGDTIDFEEHPSQLLIQDPV